jgi:DNA-binding CsgD family transcriptional regulator
MTCCSDTAARAVDALERIEAAEDLWGTLAAVAGGYGFDHMLAYRLGATDPSAAEVVRTTAPPDLVRAFERSGFTALIEPMLTAGRPFLVSERPTPQLTEEQCRLVAYGRQNLGAADVLVLPIRNLGKPEGVVVLSGRQPVPPVVCSSLHLLAHIAFAGATDAKANRKIALSPREAECLRLAAHGNTDAAIGRLLSISPRTARFHIENAKKKLGVTTRSQAVAEALRINAIAA